LSDKHSSEIDALRNDIARLTGRIYALEQVVERLAAAAQIVESII
jgi:hypothetical protein